MRINEVMGNGHMNPTVDRIRDTTENITFPATFLPGRKNSIEARNFLFRKRAISLFL